LLYNVKMNPSIHFAAQNTSVFVKTMPETGRMTLRYIRLRQRLRRTLRVSGGAAVANAKFTKNLPTTLVVSDFRRKSYRIHGVNLKDILMLYKNRIMLLLGLCFAQKVSAMQSEACAGSEHKKKFTYTLGMTEHGEVCPSETWVSDRLLSELSKADRDMIHQLLVAQKPAYITFTVKEVDHGLIQIINYSEVRSKRSLVQWFLHYLPRL
jgi:hypothetical protein